MAKRLNFITFSALFLCGFVLCLSAQTLVPTARPLPPEVLKKREAGTAFSLGRLFLKQRDKSKFPTALENFEKSSKLYKELGDLPNFACAMIGIGLVEIRLNRTSKAAQTYRRALSLFTEYKGAAIDSRSLAKLGFLYDELVDKEPVFRFSNDDLTIRPPKKGFDQNGDPIDYRFSQLSERYYFQFFNQPFSVNIKPYEPGGILDDPRFAGYSEYPDPVSIYDDVLAIWKFNGYENLEVAVGVNLMEAWADDNRDVSIFYGKLAINQYQEIRAKLTQTKRYQYRKFVNQLAGKFRFLADLLIANGRFGEAEQVLRMLKQEEHFDFLRRDADEIKSLNQRISLSENEKKLIERYSTFSSRVTELGAELSSLNAKKSKLLLSTEESARLDELNRQIADANAAFDLFLEKVLVAELGKAAKNEIAFDRSLQTYLTKWGEDTVLLYTVLSEDRYRVVLTTAKVTVDGKTDISAEKLNEKIFEYRKALQNIEIDPRPLGKELYDILIKPIEKDLIAANAKTLVWSLDGTLRYIPISTLSPDGKTYLVEKYRNVITTPSTREDVSDIDHEWRALGVGVSKGQIVSGPDDPAKKFRFSDLPGTKYELTAIVRDESNPNETGILGGKRYLDDDFTVKSLTGSLSKNTRKKFSAVHIASHFILGSDWTNSFLLLGNGKILTLKDLKNSPEIDFSSVELVTLSACDTAFTLDSNGTEVDSLAEVIQAKKGKAVLAALWAVVDESTPILMAEFYRQRKENPQMTKAEAMQKVQRAFLSGDLKPNSEYIEKLAALFSDLKNAEGNVAFKFERSAPFAHPYFWSPFVLIGNWR